MKVWLSSYQLKTLHSQQVRPGYLLKISTNDFAEGYADLFPWPEYGDPEVHQIKNLILAERKSPLIEKSFLMAQRDGRARAQNQSLLESLRFKNHFLVPDLLSLEASQLEDLFIKAQDQGFDRFKIKVCRDWSLEQRILSKSVKHLKDKTKLRLDCNLKAPTNFFNSLLTFKDFIELIEDPFLSSDLWPDQDWVAYDHPPFAYETVDSTWQIMKPAYQNVTDAKANQVIVTSYLDHPIGIAHAFFEASFLGVQKNEYGLMSHFTYEPNEFYSEIQTEGPWLSFKPGPGIGFEEHLKQQDWQRIL